MANLVTLESQQQTLQTTLTLDVSSIWPHIDSFAPGDDLETNPVSFGGVMITLAFYPKGDEENVVVVDTSFFVNIDNTTNDVAIGQRIVDVHIQCGCTEWTFKQKRKVQDFDGDIAVGYEHFAPSSFLQANPIITVHFTMYCNPSIIPAPKSAQYLQQCKAMGKWSEEEGDVTLHVIEHQDLDESDHSVDQQPCEPPQKQRKLNKNGEANKEESQEAADENKASSEGSEELEVRVSGVLLKSASPVFERMLESKMKESQEKRICVHARSRDDVLDMVYLLWTDELRSDADAFGVIQLAHYFELERLKYACINQIIQTLSLESFVDAIITFNEHIDGVCCEKQRTNHQP